ncbi:hypothetical protein, partial [Pseudomonas sp.]|uniref:hypothetical protein n=1 Tax=Pseudomonas sp. TaxID=306 RepID=UPI003916D1E3
AGALRHHRVEHRCDHRCQQQHRRGLSPAWCLRAAPERSLGAGRRFRLAAQQRLCAQPCHALRALPVRAVARQPGLAGHLAGALQRMALRGVWRPFSVREPFHMVMR